MNRNREKETPDSGEHVREGIPTFTVYLSWGGFWEGESLGGNHFGWSPRERI